MNENRSILPFSQKSPGAAIMTPQGPAIIQVIDIPSSNELSLDYAGGAGYARRKPAGMNILGAVLRRWWLVALMTAIIGTAGYFGGNMLQPTYDAMARVTWHDPAGTGNGGGTIRNIVSSSELLLTSRDIPLLAAQNAELQAALPQLFQGLDLKNLHDQQKIIQVFKEYVSFNEEVPGTEVVDIVNTPNSNSNEKIATAVVNAFANAFVQHCRQELTRQLDEKIPATQKQLDDSIKLYTRNQEAVAILKTDSYDAQAQEQSATLDAINKTMQKLEEARYDLVHAQAMLTAFQNGGERRPEQEIERLKLIEELKQKDEVLQGYNKELVEALANLALLRSKGMTDEHPDIRDGAIPRVKRAQANIDQRLGEIASIIEKRITELQKLTDLSTRDKAKAEEDKAQKMVDAYTGELKRLNEQTKHLGPIKAQIEALNVQSESLATTIKGLSEMLEKSKRDLLDAKFGGGFNVDEAGWAKLKEDKRIKVKAAGMVGGLFIGILLALLVDKFDKRLRDPRDLEPMLSVPLLGTIPRIQELKRIKGEQARNLIAEEFRVIRTQVLFGNPNLPHKIIAITSPAPGDGKTSLAVNLAISIAKAGRRCLLVDGDLRKPDIHRVFNMPENPGFAELIQGSHEPSAVIRKSEIEGLHILPAGSPINRPAELLSRPEVQRLLLTLGQLYDHVILDTAPLLPVSDTHVLAGMVDGVICSFNAEVDRDIVAMTQDVLRRCRANVIGSVMNQVKYKQSGSYHRGKSAYNSYYNRPRSKETNLATVTKP